MEECPLNFPPFTQIQAVTLKTQEIEAEVDFKPALQFSMIMTNPEMSVATQSSNLLFP